MDLITKKSGGRGPNLRLPKVYGKPCTQYYGQIFPFVASASQDLSVVMHNKIERLVFIRDREYTTGAKLKHICSKKI